MPLSEVWAMLDSCASGYTYREGKHNYHVRYRDRLYLRLPTGEHGKADPEIQIGLVRALVRQLGIDWDCAHHCIPLIGKGASSQGASPLLSLPKKQPPPLAQPKKGGKKRRR